VKVFTKYQGPRAGEEALSVWRSMGTAPSEVESSSTPAFVWLCRKSLQAAATEASLRKGAGKRVGAAWRGWGE